MDTNNFLLIKSTEGFNIFILLFFPCGGHVLWFTPPACRAKRPDAFPLLTRNVRAEIPRANIFLFTLLPTLPPEQL